MHTEQHHASVLTGPARWIPLAFLLLGLVIVAVDSSLLNVSIGPIIRDLHTTITQMQWVISAYSLTLAALVVTGGRLGDLFGRKRMFMLGSVIFAAGSLLASLSTNFSTLLIGEAIIEGIGAALMSPATSSLLVSIYQGRDRAIAYGFWGSGGAIGLVIGPLLGGFFATHYSWRWGFRINLLVVAILLIGSRFLPADRDLKEHRNFDWPGVLLSVAGMVAIMFAIIESPTYGVIRSKAPLIVFGRVLQLGDYSAIPLIACLGLGILALFAWNERLRERRGLSQLVSPHLFANRQFMGGVLGGAFFGLAHVSLMFVLAIFFQTVAGLDALHAGYVYLPLALTLLVAGPLAGYLGTKIQPRLVVQMGFALLSIEALYIGHILAVGTSVWDTVPAIMLAGIGLGLLSSQLSNLTLSAVPISDAGEASGVLQTFRQVSGALGIAISGAIIVAISSSHFQLAVQSDPQIPAVDRPALVAAAASEGSSFEFEGLRVPASVTSGVRASQLALGAVVDGNRTAFDLIAVFPLFGLIATSWLPARKQERS